MRMGGDSTGASGRVDASSAATRRTKGPAPLRRSGGAPNGRRQVPSMATTIDHRPTLPTSGGLRCPYPTPAGSVSELARQIEGCAHVDGDALVIDDEAAFRDRRHPRRRLDGDVQRGRRDRRGRALDRLGGVAAARRASASIHELYMARGRGEVPGFTVPAINLRTQVFDMAPRSAGRRTRSTAGTVIFELARSEQEYTFQRPGEYITSVLAGCIAAGWHGPVFVQGDHYQFNAKKYAADPEGTTECHQEGDARRHRRRLPEHRHRLVDAGRPLAAGRGHPAAHELRARGRAPAAVIREVEPAGMTISVGGEIGEVGKENSNEAELRAYLDGYRRELTGWPAPTRSASPRSASRPARATAACRCPGGGVAGGQAGLRDPGAALGGRSRVRAWRVPSSTARRRCRTSCSTTFPQVETAEIHLATGFQNAALRPPGVPGGPACRDRGLVPRSTRPTSASRARRQRCSSTRRARRRSARSSASCGSCRPRTRSSPTRRPRSASCSTSCQDRRGRERLVERYIHPLEHTGPRRRHCESGPATGSLTCAGAASRPHWPDQPPAAAASRPSRE